MMSVTMRTLKRSTSGTASLRVFARAVRPLPIIVLTSAETKLGRAAEKRDELAPVHSITSSARASRVGGTSRPSVIGGPASFESDYFFGCCGTWVSHQSNNTEL